MVQTRRFRDGKNSTRQYKQKKHHSTHRRKVKRYSRRGTKRRRRKRTKRVKRGGWRGGGNKARYQVVGYKLSGDAHAAQLIKTDAAADTRRVEWVSSGWASPNNKKFITNSINSNKKLKEYLNVERLIEVGKGAQQPLIPPGGQVSRVSLSENLTTSLGRLTDANATAVENGMIVFPVKISWTRKQDAVGQHPEAGRWVRGGANVHWAGEGSPSTTTRPLEEKFYFHHTLPPAGVWADDGVATTHSGTTHSGSAPPAPAAAAAEEPERRVADGDSYTKAEFVEFYGGLKEWDAAVMSSTDPAAVAAAKSGSFHVFIKRCVCRENECMSFLNGGTNWPDQAEMLNINTIIGKECPILKRKVRNDYGSSVHGQ